MMARGSGEGLAMTSASSRLLLILAASLSLAGVWQRPVAAQLLGPEFQVNSYTTGHQWAPAVAPTSGGGFVVVWQSHFFGQPQRADVVGRRFDAAGSPIGGDFPINTFTAENQGSPIVAADAGGNFVVAWQSYSQDGSYYGVFGQRFGSTGAPLGAEFQVNTTTFYFQKDPAVARSAGGDFLVVWENFLQSAGIEALGQLFDGAGLPVGSEFAISDSASGRGFSPAVAADGAGNFIVVWKADTSGSDEVLARRFDPTGVPLGANFQVNTFTTGAQDGPAVAADPAGNFFVVWNSWGQDGSVTGVFGQRFDASGIPQGAEFQVNSYATNHQRTPAVAINSAGMSVVVWSGSPGLDGSGDGVFGRRFDSGGLPMGSEFLVNSYTPYAQLGPVAVSADGAGRFVIVWRSGHEGSYPPSWGLFGRRLTLPYFYGGFEPGDFREWSSVCNEGDVCP